MKYGNASSSAPSFCLAIVGLNQPWSSLCQETSKCKSACMLEKPASLCFLFRVAKQTCHCFTLVFRCPAAAVMPSLSFKLHQRLFQVAAAPLLRGRKRLPTSVAVPPTLFLAFGSAPARAAVQDDSRFPCAAPCRAVSPSASCRLWISAAFKQFLTTSSRPPDVTHQNGHAVRALRIQLKLRLGQQHFRHLIVLVLNSAQHRRVTGLSLTLTSAPPFNSALTIATIVMRSGRNQCGRSARFVFYIRD